MKPRTFCLIAAACFVVCFLIGGTIDAYRAAQLRDCERLALLLSRSIGQAHENINRCRENIIMSRFGRQEIAYVDDYAVVFFPYGSLAADFVTVTRGIYDEIKKERGVL